MVCGPTANELVEKTATPLFSGDVPSATEPSVNVTLPVARPLDAATVAVNVAVCPRSSDEAEALRDVVVETEIMLKGSALLLTAVKSVVPT